MMEQKYRVFIDRLFNAKDIEIMLSEIKATGFNYITEDVLKVIDYRIHKIAEFSIHNFYSYSAYTGKKITPEQKEIIDQSKDKIEKYNLIKTMLQADSDIDHYLKTGRHSFTWIAIRYKPNDFANKSKFAEVKELSNEAFQRIKSMTKFFESTESKNEMLNNIFDLLKEFENKSKTLNYKEYFTSLQNKILALKTETETSTGKREQKENLPPKWTKENIFTKPEYLSQIISELISDEVLNPKGELIIEKNEILAITEALQILGIISNEIKPTQRNIIFSEIVKKKITERTATAKGKFHSERLTHYKDLFTRLAK